MGLIDPDDEDLHYSDNSHRWTGPVGVDEEVWERRVRRHQERHRGGEAELPRPSPRDGTTPPTTGPLPRPTR